MCLLVLGAERPAGRFSPNRVTKQKLALRKVFIIGPVTAQWKPVMQNIKDLLLVSSGLSRGEGASAFPLAQAVAQLLDQITLRAT